VPARRKIPPTIESGSVPLPVNGNVPALLLFDAFADGRVDDAVVTTVVGTAVAGVVESCAATVVVVGSTVVKGNNAADYASRNTGIDVPLRTSYQSSVTGAPMWTISGSHSTMLPISRQPPVPGKSTTAAMYGSPSFTSGITA
jgi:hypothetical protein